MSTLRLALAQVSVSDDKQANINKAVSLIKKAKLEGAELIVLPEWFNTPYGANELNVSENIPLGVTCQALSNAAKQNAIFVIGGTIPEIDENKFYNTCTVWNPSGDLIAKFRKIHLIDMDIKGKVTYRESDTITPGSDLTTIEIKNFKIGLGVCHDLRFEEMARIYRNRGCNMLIYPGAFHTVTGPLHWQLVGRSRANDTQSYVACVSPAHSPDHDFTEWGHTQLIGPWGNMIAELGTDEDMIIKDIDLSVVDEVRAAIPVYHQRRTDLYDTISKK